MIKNLKLDYNSSISICGSSIGSSENTLELEVSLEVLMFLGDTKVVVVVLEDATGLELLVAFLRLSNLALDSAINFAAPKKNRKKCYFRYYFGFNTYQISNFCY
eukprot:TRINITY_DN10319_c0_g2_i2.p1 TRINITY_DN10319_c0_g2~~TRINITY_DN10319_c0_g2_i2.p1  ORF type:complete len:104 (-),score=12.24 TRINITY_DN10319_c0_g2_i2:261-572(-)